jgi:hypothetical protein
MKHDMYYWVHLPTGLQGAESWTARDMWPSEKQKLELLNEWNRVAMIGSGTPTYHYWM